MEPPAAFPLGDCHPSILQRIINRCDREDLFLLRAVSRSFRVAVEQRVRRLRPTKLPADMAARFPGLQSLDLRDCFPDDTEEQLGPLLPQLPHLRELLNLKPGNLAPEWLMVLQPLTRLELWGAPRAEGLLAMAAQCRSLQQLDVLDCEQLLWRDLHLVMAHLASSLTELSLSSEEGPHPLLQEHGLLPFNTGRLQTLYMQLDEAPASVPTQLAAFSSLTALHLTCSEGMDLAQLAALTRLTRLALSTASTEQGVNSITRLTRLADLRLPYFTAAPASALATLVASFPGLTALNISCPREGTFGALSGLTRLTCLSARFSTILQQPGALRGLRQLRRLELRGSLREESQLQHLSDLVSLSRLELSDNEYTVLELSHEGLGWLTRMTVLEQLGLAGGGSFKSGALEQLAWLPALRVLDLSYRKLELSCLVQLMRLPLAWLRLPGNYQSADALPHGLRAAFLKGRRRSFWELGDGDLF